MGPPRVLCRIFSNQRAYFSNSTALALTQPKIKALKILSVWSVVLMSMERRRRRRRRRKKRRKYDNLNNISLDITSDSGRLFTEQYTSIKQTYKD